MVTSEPDALWEQALQQQEEDENRLVDEIVETALYWTGGNAAKAERILTRTKYLKGKKNA